MRGVCWDLGHPSPSLGLIQTAVSRARLRGAAQSCCSFWLDQSPGMWQNLLFAGKLSASHGLDVATAQRLVLKLYSIAFISLRLNN